MARKVLILFCVAILAACRSNYASITSMPSIRQPRTMQLPISDNCIDPIIKLAYSFEPQNEAVRWEDVLPLPPWKEVVRLPSNLGRILSWGTRMELSRPQAKHSEIWVKVQVTSSENDFIGIPYGYLIYRAGYDPQWKSVPPLEVGKITWMPQEIFLDKTNSVWGVQNLPNHPLFVHYDDETNRYEFVHDNQGLLDDPARYRFLLVDRDGIFWLSSYDGLYNFDPTTKEAWHRLRLDEYMTDGAQMQDGSIYFQVEYKNEILHFLPEADQFERIKIPLQGIYDPVIQEVPSGMVALYDLFADHADRLWIDDYGWLEPDGTWYQLIRSSAFISEGMQDHTRYAWERPEILVESVDGLLWFRFTMGLVSLDPQIAKWCWVTTYPLNIVEDHQRNLWMLADGKLYKYQVER